MTKRKIFYSFHFDNDVMRTQLVRNMGVIEGNEPVSKNAWEDVKRGGDSAIEKWIADTLKDKSCAIVLVGTDTHKRPWVKYEMKKAWRDGKALFGIYVHNLKCPNYGKVAKGTSPFLGQTFKKANGDEVTIKCYDPDANDAYNDISKNLSTWVEAAIKQAS